MINQSPIFSKTEVFLVWLLERAERFRKTQRFIIGARIQNSILDFQEALVEASREKNPTRILKNANTKLEILRHHIRTCVELKLLTLKQYEFASQNMLEIGNLLGGWLRKFGNQIENKGGSPAGESGERVGVGNK